MLTAFFTDDVGFFRHDGFLDLFVFHRQFFGKRTVEAADDILPFFPAFRYFIQSFFHLGRKGDIDDFAEIFRENLIDHFADFGGEKSHLLFNVISDLDHRNGRGIS